MHRDKETVSAHGISLKAARIVEVTGDLPPMPHIAAQVMEQALRGRLHAAGNSPSYYKRPGACRPGPQGGKFAVLRGVAVYLHSA